LKAIARLDFGLTDREFWRLTFAEWRALFNRTLEREKRKDIRFGVLAALYRNAHKEKGARDVSAEEVFGHKKPSTEQTSDQQLAFCRMFAALHNARIAKK
jgi:hypothetical protein